MCIILCGDFQLNISPSFNGYQQQNINNRPSFKAIPKADYRVLGNPASITVFQLEKKDIELLKKFTSNITEFFKKYDIKDESRKQVVEEAFNAAIQILKGEKKPEEKAKILMAFSEKEPCGIIIGNALKVDKRGKFHYSSRKNHTEGETELDWLATWNNKLKGVGKTLVNEFFHTLPADDFGHVYVRSEIPEKSCAVKFYECMGFKPLTEDYRVIQRKNDNGYLIGTYDALDDLVVGMKANTKRINEVIAKREKELNRDVRKMPCSYDLAESIAIAPSTAKSCNIRPR